MNHTKTFTLHRSTSKDLDKSYEKYKRNHPHEYNTLSKHANKLIKDGLAIEYLQEKVAAAFSVTLNPNNSKLLVEDQESGRVFTVIREDHRLLCRDDKSHNCKHVMAAMISPKTAVLFRNSEMAELPVRNNIEKIGA